MIPPQRASLVQLAERHTLTAYDAAYLELCMRHGLTLLALDEKLIRAAAEGVKCAP